MAPDFQFFGVPPLYFGSGRVSELSRLVPEMGSRALLVHSGSLEGGSAARAHALLGGVLPLQAYRQRGEPKVTDVDAALVAARDGGCDVIVAVGGGSAIDCAKAVAGLLTNGGAALDYMEVIGKGQKISKPAAPWIAVPTTAGTGAEVTRNAVIGDPDKKFKASIRSEHLLPRAVIIDPQLGMDVPPGVTASSGMDALCQCVESYTSNGANPITDPLALQGFTLAARSLWTAFSEGANLQAREDMALAALLSGITLTNAGLGAVHGFAAPLGANFPVPHGVVCAVLLPHVIEANVSAVEEAEGVKTLHRYATLGRIADGRNDLPAPQAIAALVRFTRRLVRDLKIPPLGVFGMTAADVPAMVALAKKASSMRFNPVVLNDTVLGDVLRAAIERRTGDAE